MAVVNADAYALDAGFIYACPFTNGAIPQFAGLHYHRCYSLSGVFYPPCQNQDSANHVSFTFQPGDPTAAMKAALVAYQVDG